MSNMMRPRLYWWDERVINATTTKEQLQEIIDTSPPDDIHDFVLYTDGSGTVDGIGSAAYVFDAYEQMPGQKPYILSTQSGGVGMVGSSVTRNELTAITLGLHDIIEFAVGERARRGTLESADVLPDMFTYANRLRIKLYSDRADIVRGMLYNEDGDTLTARKKNKDLWYLLSYYATMCVITPVHNKRNVVEKQAVADGMCKHITNSMKGAYASIKLQYPDIDMVKHKSSNL